MFPIPEARRIAEPLRAAPFISRIDAFIADVSTPVGLPPA